MHPDTFTKYLRQLYDENGFPMEYHLRILRHYFVSTMLHNGVDKQTVAELAGHGDTGFLERTYCHPQMRLKRDAANQLAHSLFDTAGQLCQQSRRVTVNSVESTARAKITAAFPCGFRYVVLAKIHLNRIEVDR